MKLYDLALQRQKDYEYPIILAMVNGRYRELMYHYPEGSRVEFVTTAEKMGYDCYRRSALLLLLKAAYDVVGGERMDNLKVMYSIGVGQYCEWKMEDRKLDQDLLKRIESRMRELSRAAIPIEKQVITTEEAIARFHKHHMYDKEKLFKYRRASTTNVYRLEGYEDYFYGYMAPNTDCIDLFDLKLYGDGFVLILPERQNPRQIPEFQERPKLYRTLKESRDWSRTLGGDTVGALNQMIVEGKVSELVLVQEALQEKKLAEIADRIVEENKRIVLIAGPSSSGKTTFSHRLSIQLRVHGKQPHPIGLDNYFIERDRIPAEPDGTKDYEKLNVLDIRQFNEDMNALLQGKAVNLPHYNFLTGKREYGQEVTAMGDNDVLVIEGIHGLNPELTSFIDEKEKFRIYISALTMLNVDEHNRVPTTDGREIRRMVRDAIFRGEDAAHTIARWPSVRKGEEQYIFPFQEEADVMFNSGMIYELAVLKQYAEPLLFQVPKDSPEYPEAKRLLKFLDYFLGIDSNAIPGNSIIKEFIGGSCFDV